jgi:heavy metal sensor kinase
MYRIFGKSWERILLKRGAGKVTSSMIKSLRWRLQLWHAIILFAAVTLFGAAFYRELHRSTLGEIDAELLSAARVLEGTLRSLPSSMQDKSLADLPLELPPRLGRRRPGPPPFEPDPSFSGSPDNATPDGMPPPDRRPPPPHDFDDTPLYFAIYSKEGQLLRNESGDVEIAWAAPRRPLDYRNVNERREVLLRGPNETLIIVGRDIQQTLGRLTQSLVQLIVIGALVLCLGLVGGWWLAGNAIRPIKQISATAENISAQSLSERIDTAAMDEELQSLGATLNSMLTRLEDSFQQQSRFTADASHELRTPISVLLTHCELALNRPRSAEEYQRTISICQNAAMRMKSLVDGLLTLARADAAKLELQVTEIDLHKLAAEAIAMLAPFARERQIEIALEGTAALCRADAGRIHQVIVNLIHNAIAYNRPSGHVTVNTSVADASAILQVTDTGSGIAPESQPHVFERFYRVDQSRSRQVDSNQEGSGLGLSICKSIIDAHGGRLSFTSKLNEGSMFEMKLPKLGDFLTETKVQT